MVNTVRIDDEVPDVITGKRNLGRNFSELVVYWLFWVVFPVIWYSENRECSTSGLSN